MFFVRPIAIIAKIIIACGLLFIVLSNKNTSTYLTSQDNKSINEPFNAFFDKLTNGEKCSFDNNLDQSFQDNKVVGSLLDQIEELTNKLELQETKFEKDYVNLYNEYVRINDKLIENTLHHTNNKPIDINIQNNIEHTNKSIYNESVQTLHNANELSTQTSNIANESIEPSTNECYYRWSLLHYVLRAFGTSNC